VPVVK